MELWEPVLEALWRQSRFTSYFYQMVSFVEDGAMDTLMLTVRQGRVSLCYNPAFLEGLSEAERMGLLVHEMMHQVFGHDHRGYPDEHPHLQNLAQDMVINSWIVSVQDDFFSISESRLTLPPGLPMVPASFYMKTGEADPSWERVYRFLKSDEPDVFGEFSEGLKELFKQNPSGGGELSEALGMEFSGLSEDETSEVGRWQPGASSGNPLPTGAHDLSHDMDAPRMHRHVHEALKLAGGDFRARDERLVQEVSALIKGVADVDVRPLTRKIRTIVARGTPSRNWEYSASRFNRRYFAQGIYSAGRQHVDKKLVTVVVDLSASMVTHPKHIEEAFGAVEGLIADYRINLLCIDETLFVPEKTGGRFVKGGGGKRFCNYRRGDWRYLRSGNSGTTFFSPLFNDYLKRGHRECVVVITDGEIYDLESLAPYANTLWLLPSDSKQFDPSFGEAVRLR